MRSGSFDARWWPAGIAAAALVAVAAALVSQYVFYMQPCPWCVLQRLLFVAIALAGTVGIFVSGRAGRILSGALVSAFALLGVAAAAWQHWVAAKASSCSIKKTLAEKIVSDTLHLNQLLPSVFAPQASCGEAAADLLRIPYEFWSLGLFAALGFAAIRYMLAPIQGPK
jgi:disulfide bond formation protein DsbB